MSQEIQGVQPAPRFANVSCSQCGREFGPGNAGFSHCQDHQFAIGHTPGPWSYRHEGQNEFGAEVWTLDAEEIGHSEIAETYTLENARLIAAAPDLLAVLRRFRDQFDAFDPSDKKSRQAMRMTLIACDFAIAKATGAQA